MTIEQLEQTISDMRAAGWRVTEIQLPTTMRPTYMVQCLDPKRVKARTVQSIKLEVMAMDLAALAREVAA
jgi:hypothetical protein